MSSIIIPHGLDLSTERNVYHFWCEKTPELRNYRCIGALGSYAMGEVDANVTKIVSFLGTFVWARDSKPSVTNRLLGLANKIEETQFASSIDIEPPSEAKHLENMVLAAALGGLTRFGVRRQFESTDFVVGVVGYRDNSPGAHYSGMPVGEKRVVEIELSAIGYAPKTPFRPTRDRNKSRSK